MSESLRDQLLKTGLVQKLKSEAKPTPKPPSRGPNAPHHGKGPQHGPTSPHHGKGPRPPQNRPPAPPRPASSEPDLAQAYAQRARLEREEKDRAQRDAERQAQEKRERKLKLAKLLEGKALNAADADVPRHFPHANKIRRIYCTPAQLVELNRGELAVVQHNGRYLLTPREIAVSAQGIAPESLVLLVDPNAPADDDVPADLVW